MTPEQHDEQLLMLEAEQRRLERLATQHERIYRIRHLGQRRRGGAWTTLDGSPATLPIDDSDAAQRFMASIAEVESIRNRIAEHEQSYTGWSRFRLVTSSNDGHVHGRSDCRTFRSATKTVVVPGLSDKAVDDVVALLGPVCCGVCLPGAVGTAKIPSSLVSVLVRRGSDAFTAALNRRAALRPNRRDDAS